MVVARVEFPAARHVLLNVPIAEIERLTAPRPSRHHLLNMIGTGWQHMVDGMRLRPGSRRRHEDAAYFFWGAAIALSHAENEHAETITLLSDETIAEWTGQKPE